MRETARRRSADGRETEGTTKKRPVVATRKGHYDVRIAIAIVVAVLDDEASWHFIARNY
jgi:hypothetical protein